MKLIDKYLLRQFVVPLCCCLLTFSMIFIIADLFDRLSDFVEAGTPVLHAVRYYVYLLPSLLVFIAPLSLLLGILYCLWRLSRNSELIAMRACGINFYRICIPFIVVGIGCSILVGVVQETIAPWSSYWAWQFITRQVRREDLSTRYARDLSFKNERDGRIWAIRKFDLDTYAMEGIKLVRMLPDGYTETLYAEDGKYFDGRWWFFNITTRKRDSDGSPVGTARVDLIREMTDLSERPRDFANIVKDPEFLSARELWEFMQAHAQLAGAARARLLVDMHVRVAMPWTCLVVILFGIPCGVHTGRKGAFMGILIALATFFAFYLLMTISHWMGKAQVVGAFWSAWMPNFVFLSLGLWMTARTK